MRSKVTMHVFLRTVRQDQANHTQLSVMAKIKELFQKHVKRFSKEFQKEKRILTTELNMRLSFLWFRYTTKKYKICQLKNLQNQKKTSRLEKILSKVSMCKTVTRSQSPATMRSKTRLTQAQQIELLDKLT